MLSARVYSVQSYMELKQCHGIKGVLCGVHTKFKEYANLS